MRFKEFGYVLWQVVVDHIYGIAEIKLIQVMSIIGPKVKKAKTKTGFSCQVSGVRMVI